MKISTKLWVTFVIAFFAISAKAQLFFYKDGYYQKNNNHWTEFQLTKVDKGVIKDVSELDRFIEYSEDDTYYYIDSGKYKIAVPKAVGQNFYSRANGQEDWRTLYPREEFKEIEYIVNIHDTLRSFTIYADGKAEFSWLYTDDTWFSIPETISFNNLTYVVDIINCHISGDNLEHLTIPNSVTKIERLYTDKISSKKLKNITIPGSVNEINPKMPFGYDSTIENIVFEGTTPYDHTLYLRDMPNLKIIKTYRPFPESIWITGSKKFKKVENFSGQRIIVRDYLDKDPKYY